MLNSTTSEPAGSQTSSFSESRPAPRLNPLDLVKLASAAEAERRRRDREKMAERVRTEEDERNPSLILRPSSPYHDLWKPAPFITLYGGRDSAKSWSVAEYLIRRARVEPILVLCTREFQSSIKDSVHRLLKKTISRLWFGDHFTITDKSIRSRAGAEFIFKGLRVDPDGVKSTEGIHVAWVEEGQHTTDDSWEILIPTVRAEGSKIITTFNVTDEESPTHQRLVTNPQPGSIAHLVNYDQNPYLSDKSKAAIAHLKATDYDAYLHVYEGRAKKISDSIIFGGRYRIEDFPDDLWEKAERLFFGLDHGFAQDPYALVRFFIYQRKLYIEYEAFGTGVEFAGEMTPDGRGELEQLLDSVPLSRQWLIKADNSRPETISFLVGKNFRVEAAKKWKGCVEDGIAHIKGFEAIIIHPRCKHMTEEARLYSFKKDRMTGEVLPIVVDKHNHGWDAVRYGMDGYIQATGDMAVWERMADG